MGSKGSIIFLTSSTDHALDAFRVEAMQYLVKPILKKDLFSALDRFLSEFCHGHVKDELCAVVQVQKLAFALGFQGDDRL